MKKLLTIFILGIFLISLASAGLFTSATYQEVGKYGRYLIKDYCIPFTSICFSGTVQEVQLNENDGENCGRFCASIAAAFASSRVRLTSNC